MQVGIVDGHAQAQEAGTREEEITRCIHEQAAESRPGVGEMSGRSGFRRLLTAWTRLTARSWSCATTSRWPTAMPPWRLGSRSRRRATGIPGRRAAGEDPRGLARRHVWGRTMSEPSADRDPFEGVAESFLAGSGRGGLTPCWRETRNSVRRRAKRRAVWHHSVLVMIVQRRPARLMAPLAIEDSSMSEAMDFSSDHSARLEALIGEFLGAMQSGRPVEREIWLAAHPDLAEGLRAFLADYDQFQNLAAPLRDVADGAATVAHETAGFWIASGPSPVMSYESGDAAASPAVGTSVQYFGDYEPLRTLGEGGMGIVFEARQRSLDRIVALKMIRAGRFAGEDDLRRFRNEAEAVAKLDHPHIVPVYEVGEHEGHNYFSMKRIDGTSLAANLSGYRDRPREAARLVATVARAVHHAHQRGVLHRDLKPSNVLLDARGEPHLTDFGLAKRLQGNGAAEATHTGAILGTPAYMAPEQAGGGRGEVTTATDVYGLGALLYALLTGQAPFRGESLAETLLQVREGSPDPIRKSNPKVPRDLETICMRCLEREPRRRYASADAVADELERWLKGEPITARPVGTLERGWMWCRRNPLVAGLTACGRGGVDPEHGDLNKARPSSQRPGPGRARSSRSGRERPGRGEQGSRRDRIDVGPRPD